MASDTVNVRYMGDDVDASIAFYSEHFGFRLQHSAAPAFADVHRGSLRLLLSGPGSSAGRPTPDGRKPVPGGWNRITSSLTISTRRSSASGPLGSGFAATS